MLEIFISAASYYCPFALIRGLTRVSVRVCSIAVDPMGPRGVTDKMVSEPTLYRTCGRKHERNVSLWLTTERSKEQVVSLCLKGVSR